ncbi:MAG: 3-methyl-2-oxobutanoate hydroxymethyltransferase, partial [Pseudomonadota bacterium]
MYTHLQQAARDRPPVSLTTLNRMKADGEKLAAITAYDASFAVAVDLAGADVVLVGDSLGMVVQGHDTTRSCGAPPSSLIILAPPSCIRRAA